MVEGETITDVTFDLKNHFQAAIDQYLEPPTEKLNEVNTPVAPRLASEKLDPSWLSVASSQIMPRAWS